MIKLICTFFYSGTLTKAPGTVGSAATIPLWLLLQLSHSIMVQFLAIIFLFIVGVFCVSIYTKGMKNHDPKEVVIDEVVGMLITYFPLVPFFSTMTWPRQLAFLLLGFCFFRVFDILKPGLIKTVDNMNNAFGVMFDDVLAGLAAAFALIGILVMLGYKYDLPTIF